MRTPSRSIRPSRRSRFAQSLIAGTAALSLAACSDAVAPAPALGGLRLESSEGRGYFQRYVAMGTSISAGVASDGLVAASQEQAWPAQLARLGHREISLPLVAWPGCNAPLAAPIISGRRIDGTAATAFGCARNAEGVVLPANDVAVDGSRVAEALFGPNPADPQRVAKHGVILPAGMTQVSAMQAQDPKLVSVELGANEVLGASRGILIPNTTIVPFATFASQYDQVLDAVEAENPKAVVLVGLIQDVGAFPAFRSGAELYAQRTALTNFGIVLTEACNTTNAGNLVFVPVKIPTLAAIANATRTPQVWDCGDVPFTVDYVLTPGDRGTVNALIGQMNAHIQQEAQARGWAYFSLGEALFEAPGVRVSYNPIQQFMSTDAPYGSFISFDGYHPSALGQTMIAQAAARALNAKYGMEIPLLMEEVIAGN